MTRPAHQCVDCFDSGSMCERCLAAHRPSLPPYSGGWPTPRQPLGRTYEYNPDDHDSWVRARFGEPPVLLTESAPCEAFALRPTIADSELATCPACVEFGTICRPCRKARYEAHRAAEQAVERRALRFRIWSSVALGVAVLLLGLFLQSRWDAQCAAEQPGTRWNGDLWGCEAVDAGQR